VPSKPGYETLSQARPGRHSEVAWSRRRDRLPRSSGLHAARPSMTNFPCLCFRSANGLLIAAPAKPGSMTSQAPDPDIGAGAYVPSTEIRTRIDIPL
jgi:hypothetical protein